MDTQYVARRLCVDLRPEQVEKLRTIEWLTDESAAGEGRTTLLAIAFIKHAISNPGNPILFFDHHHATGRIMGDVIENLLEHDPAWAESFDIDRRRYVLTFTR